MDRIPGFVGVAARGTQNDLNHGNFIHAEAARRLFPTGRELGAPAKWTEADVARIRERHSHAVVIMANGIRPGFSGSHPAMKALAAYQSALADGIERLGLPVVVLGLGTQAPVAVLDETEIAEETLRLLRVLSAHSHRMAVRGAITAGICRQHGIGNVEVMGCQSLFWHRTPTIAGPRAAGGGEAALPVAFNFTDASVEAPLINLAIDAGFDLIGQGNAAEAELRSGAPRATPFRSYLPAAFSSGSLDEARYAAWVTAHFAQFHDAPSWVASMRGYRFAFGTRLHGNMAALIAGTPALWITHDARTYEICEHFRLPHLQIGAALRVREVDELIARADFSACRRIYPDRYRTLHRYLTDAGIAHALPPPVESAP